MERVTVHSNIYISALVFGGKPKRILEMACTSHLPSRSMRFQQIPTTAACSSAQWEAASDVIVSGDLGLLRIGSYAGIPIQMVAQLLQAIERQSDDAE